MCTITNKLSHRVVSCQANSLNPREQFAALVRTGAEDTGWKLGAIAALLGKEPPYLTLMLRGEKPINAEDFLALPIEVKQFVVSHLAIYLGLHVIAEQDVQEAHAQAMTALLSVMGKKRPAKADLPEVDASKAVA